MLIIPEEMLVPYGRYKAKGDHIALKDLPQKGRLVLVTAINPTPAGEGKTTVSIGLADALRLEGYNACLALREPTLGPVIGVKGGAAGGGKTYGLLLSALRYKNVKGFGCTIFRKNYKQIFAQGGLWDEAQKMYHGINGAQRKISDGTWSFRD